MSFARYPGRGQLLRAEIPRKRLKISQSWEDETYSSGLPRQPRIEGPRSLTEEKHRESEPICTKQVKKPNRNVLKILTL